MKPSPIQFRPVEPSDAEAVADVFLLSKKTFLPFAPSLHTDDTTRKWVANHLIPDFDTSVATRDNQIVGMMTLRHDGTYGWIQQLYLHPSATGQGIGSLFLQQAKVKLGSPIRLYTFQPNLGARRFYERHGFRALEFGDGSQNEEHCPDILYEWCG